MAGTRRRTSSTRRSSRRARAADLAITAPSGESGELVDAGRAALSALLLPPSAKTSPLTLRLRTAPLERAVSLVVRVVTFDGKGFHVDTKRPELAAGTSSL